MQETVQEKAPERPAQAGQLKASTGAASVPPFVDNRPSTAAQLKLAQMVQCAPKAVAQRRQMGVITGATAQLEEEDEPLQGKAEPLQRVPEDPQAVPPPAVPPPEAGAPNPPAEEPVQHPIMEAQVPAPADAVQHPIMQHPQVPQQEGAAQPPGGEPAPAEQAALEQAALEQAAGAPNAEAAAVNPVAAVDAQAAEQPGAEPVQHPIMAPAEQQAAEVQHPIQHPIQDPQAAEVQHPVQEPQAAAEQPLAAPALAPAEEAAAAPVQNKADPGAAAVSQLVARRTWGDEEPEAKAPAAQEAEQVEAAPAAPQAPAKKPGFFERMKNGVKNVAGKVGRALVNWSGQGKPPAGAAGAKPQRPGAKPAAVQAPAVPKVYKPNAKVAPIRRVPSRAPITGRADAAAKTSADMKKSMLGGASLDAVSAETKAANAPNAPNAAAAAAANPAAVVAGVIANRMRSSAPGLMRQGLSTKMGPLATAEVPTVAGKLTANSYSVGGKAYKGDDHADAATKAANVAAKQNGA
jgi:hypothetical protein